MISIAEATLFNDNNRHEAETYLIQEGLNDVIPYLLANNDANLLPYHNFNHLMTIVKWCGRMSSYYPLNAVQRRGLILAAAFHDFNHSGGHSTDISNITMALIGLTDFSCKFSIPNDVYDIAVDCIRVTEFPFRHTPTTLAQSIIRDADLLQGIEPTVKYTMVNGLRREIEVSLGRPMTEVEFCERNIMFRSSLMFYTTYAQEVNNATNPTIEKYFTDIIFNNVAV